MTNDIGEFDLACPVSQWKKGSHHLVHGELQPLEVPVRKWDHSSIFFMTHLPEVDGKDPMFDSS